MRKQFFPAVCVFFTLAPICLGQTSSRTANTPATSSTERAIGLAESGHCAEAVPLLRRAIREATTKDAKKRIGLDGLHCAMTHENPYDSLDFLQVLSRDFSGDPEVLYEIVHAYSDLSGYASRELISNAPFSYQVHELNAEALETQGKWDEAAAEYRKILQMNPLLPGIHARLGRALLAKPQPPAEAVEEAKKNFEEELEIDPRNPAAEYVLGQLSSNAGDMSSAIRHFSRATELDTTFAEAYLGLGGALIASARFEEAVAPLEKYEKLAPDSPTGHYELALAYTRLGRKEDANREAALQRESLARLEEVKRKVAEGLQQQQIPVPPVPKVPDQ